MKITKRITPHGWLRIACVLALIGLAMMMWSLFDPHVRPVLIALSVGQAIGTLSLALYVRVIIRDYREQRAKAATPPS
jgi:hypothetical protein